jgi:hypothetical protein
VKLKKAMMTNALMSLSRDPSDQNSVEKTKQSCSCCYAHPLLSSTLKKKKRMKRREEETRKGKETKEEMK